MKVQAFICPKCKQTVYARTEYDSHTCFCGSVDCRGMLTKYASDVTSFESKEIEVDTTKDLLRIDFMYNRGEYGTIKK